MSEKKTRLGFWNDRYASGVTPWDLGHVSEPVRVLVERYFPRQGRVLVPGCGRGYEVIYLAKLGFQVTAVDFADEAVRFLGELAQQSQVQPEILAQDIFLLPTLYNSSFDVLLEQTCFCAIDPSLRNDYEQLAHRVLRPGGRLLGVFMEFEEPREGPPYSTPPGLVQAQFPVSRWRLDHSEPLPRNPKRPGPEFLAVFTRLGPEG
jgi:SAM-dependent methyltransferase